MANTIKKQGTGWIAFAGIAMIIAGFYDIVSGLWALDNKNTVVDAVLWESNVETWGWIYLIVGIVVLFAGFGVFSRQTWAVMVGIFAATFGIIIELFWMFQTPVRSLIYITIAMLVIHALTVYGDKEMA